MVDLSIAPISFPGSELIVVCVRNDLSERERGTSWIASRMGEGEEPPMRGGKINARDKWFGLEGRAGFGDFRRWWHREGKDDEGGQDIATREDAERIFDGWLQSNSPTVR